jgi:predicted HAD superfamily Cof-like phosphohydrolase
MEKAVLEFHKKYGHMMSSQPNHEVPGEVKQLRSDLIMEEFNEFFTAFLRNDLVEMADGCADLIYVLVGTMISYGIPIDRIFTEVHRSNMTKTPVKATKGKKYGTKTPKGPDYIAPDIKGIIAQPGNLTVLEEQHI